jgi:polyisoprenoid-binding protein YceI
MVTSCEAMAASFQPRSSGGCVQEGSWPCIRPNGPFPPRHVGLCLCSLPLFPLIRKGEGHDCDREVRALLDHGRLVCRPRVRSSLAFRIRRPLAEPLSGRFLDFDGAVDPGRPLSCFGSVRVDSLVTRRLLWDELLLSAGLLDAGRFPMIGFVSTGVRVFDHRSFLVTGNLTIRDIARPIVLQGTFRGPFVDRDGCERVEYGLGGRVNTADFDLGSCGGLVGAHGIELRLEIAAERPALERAA